MFECYVSTFVLSFSLTALRDIKSQDMRSGTGLPALHRLESEAMDSDAQITNATVRQHSKAFLLEQAIADQNKDSSLRVRQNQGTF